jgi:hypothetical protein
MTIFEKSTEKKSSVSKVEQRLRVNSEQERTDAACGAQQWFDTALASLSQPLRQRHTACYGFPLARAVHGRYDVFIWCIACEVILDTVSDINKIPVPRLPLWPLSILCPAYAHFSPPLWRLDTHLYQVRPYPLAALIPSLHPLFGFLVRRAPFALQNAPNGFWRDFEKVCENGRCEFVGLCGVEMPYALHCVGRKPLAWVPGFSPELLFQRFLLHLPCRPFPSVCDLPGKTIFYTSLSAKAVVDVVASRGCRRP